MATWMQVQDNPTLYPQALLGEDGNKFPWHKNADKPYSSQVFCVSAFGTLRQLLNPQLIINGLLPPTVAAQEEWRIELEVEQRELLAEYGPGQPTSVDVVLEADNAVICLEAKFLRDAESGFGKCSQVRDNNCAGFFGPGSDVASSTGAWCRLEVWDGNRSPVFLLVTWESLLSRGGF